MNTHRSKRECVVIMFYIVYYRLCFQHRLDNSVPCGQPLCVYNTNGLYSLESVVATAEPREWSKKGRGLFRYLRC